MASNDSKSVIVIVHGAWHRPKHYDGLKQGLADRGFSVIQPENVTSGAASDIAGKTHLDDVAVIHQAMEEPLAAGQEITIVCHSYGGIPGSAAVEGYQIHERREKGLPGGVRHVVFVTSFALPAKNLTLLMALGGEYGDFLERRDDILALTENARKAFYNDLDPETTSRAFDDCVYQSTASSETAVPFVAADIAVPKTYVACENDAAIPIEGQLAMAGAMGETVRIEKLDSGHSPFLNKEALPKLVDILARVAS
ncbi:hypothetical protein ACJ41O_013229 [Fusarium nematophilum]